MQEFAYFQEQDSEQFAFYKIPKVLFTDPRFNGISTEAKIMYGVMLDRVSLSRKNGWIDENGNVDTEALRNDMDRISVSFRINKESGTPDTYLNGENVESEIRSMEVSSNVSHIAALPFVREAMVRQQQRMGEEKGIVMDGRDIGTTVFPDAELKIFVTASAAVRAQRRYKELLDKGMEANYDDILKNVVERDYLDSHREVSPLRKADDAIELDNSDMTIEEQSQWLVRQVSSLVS